MLMENKLRLQQDEFYQSLKAEWRLLWTERFDDRVRAEGVSVRDYPSLFMDRGDVVFAPRNAKSPSFPEIVNYWSSKGSVYNPGSAVGGWGKFIRTMLKDGRHSRARAFEKDQPSDKIRTQQLKKGGRGWLHK